MKKAGRFQTVDDLTLRSEIDDKQRTLMMMMTTTSGANELRACARARTSQNEKMKKKSSEL